METKVFHVEMKSGIRRTPEFEKKGLAGYAVNVGLRCMMGNGPDARVFLQERGQRFATQSKRPKGIGQLHRGQAATLETSAAVPYHRQRRGTRREVVLSEYPAHALRHEWNDVGMAPHRCGAAQSYAVVAAVSGKLARKHNLTEVSLAGHDRHHGDVIGGQPV